MQIIINTKRWHLELEICHHIPDHLVPPGGRRYRFYFKLYDRVKKVAIKEIKKGVH